MKSPIAMGLPSTLIELPETVFLRGQTLKGRAHILSEDAYTAKEVKVEIEVKTSSMGSEMGPFEVREPLHVEENVEVTSVERIIDFEFKIPPFVPFTFDSGLTRVEWRIILSIKSGLVPGVASRDIVVLPHLLTSEVPPSVDEIPTPACEFHGALATRYSPFHLWRYTGFLHRSSDITMSTNAQEYTAGDTIHGNIIFSKHFGSGTISLYLVFLNRPNVGGNVSETEQLILQAKGPFYPGSSLPFSCVLPATGYPTSGLVDMKAAKHRIDLLFPRIWWVLRAVVSNPFWLTKVAEKEVVVKPLTF